MKYLLGIAWLITGFALGVIYGPWVQERVHSIQLSRILSNRSQGVMRKQCKVVHEAGDTDRGVR